LFLVTDGIPETVNQKKEMIGFDKGLLGMFLRCRQNRLRDTLDSVIEETARHRNGLPPQDDITIIGFEVPE
jgi:serine phosphatase RsbU (regulator of sigma subunit)